MTLIPCHMFSCRWSLRLEVRVAAWMLLVVCQSAGPTAPARAELRYTLQDCLAAQTNADKLRVCPIIRGTEEEEAQGAVEASRILRELDRYDAAVDLISRRGSHHLLDAELGHIWFDQGDQVTADLHFQAALARGLVPNRQTRERMVVAAYWQGEHLHYSNDDPAAALGGYTRALTFDPGYAPALLGRGEALQKLNRHGDALVDLERAIGLGADWTGYLLRARSRRARGNVAGAVADFRRVLEENPGHAGALRALAEMADPPP